MRANYYLGFVFFAWLNLPCMVLSYEWKIGEAFIVGANHVQVPSKIHLVKVLKTGQQVVLNPPIEPIISEQILETTTVNSEDAETTVMNNESYNQEAISSGIPQLPIPDGKLVYPWLASITKNGKQICVGSLLDNRHVLTTAYCIYNFTSEDLTDLEVEIGFQTASGSRLRQFDLTDRPFTTAKVAKAIRHLRFNPLTAYNDIGLLQLLNPVQFGDFVQPISLTEDAIIYENQTVEQSVIGWRVGSDLNGESTLFWRDEPIKYKSSEECRMNYDDELAPQGISNEMFCRGGDKASTSCHWKFGSPLIIKDVSGENATVGNVKVSGTQIGIFSWGVEALQSECAFSEETPRPMIFTRVASFYKWIITNLVH